MNRKAIDVAALRTLSTEGPCFVCEFLAGNPDYGHHMVYEDEQVVAFLNKFPTLPGYVLVAPRQHREQVAADFSLADYLAIQTIVFRIAKALSSVTPTERVYILSLGSQQGNRHIHWHVAALPPGVLYDEQQFNALDVRRGVIDISEAVASDIANNIRTAMTT